VATLVARNANKAMVVHMVGSEFGGSLESGSLFLVGVFGRNLASVAVKMFSNLIYFKKEFYQFCTFNAIFKDNDAIDCITIQHKKGSFSSILMGYTNVAQPFYTHGTLNIVEESWWHTNNPILHIVGGGGGKEKMVSVHPSLVGETTQGKLLTIIYSTQ
jgi:hypothetical protein